MQEICRFDGPTDHRDPALHTLAPPDTTITPASRPVSDPRPVATMVLETPLGSWTQREQIDTPEHAHEVVRPLLAGLDREAGLIVSLDTRHRVLAVDTVSVGSVNHTFFAPREVFRTALARGAAAIYIAHNHPSGDPTPSDDDRSITTRLSRAGVIFGIQVIDHIIVGDDSFRSLSRIGAM